VAESRRLGQAFYSRVKGLEENGRIPPGLFVAGAPAATQLLGGHGGAPISCDRCRDAGPTFRDSKRIFPAATGSGGRTPIRRRAALAKEKNRQSRRDPPDARCLPAETPRGSAAFFSGPGNAGTDAEAWAGGTVGSS